jgi:hypothetical protein
MFSWCILQEINVWGTTNYTALGGTNAITSTTCTYGCAQHNTNTFITFQGVQVVLATASTYNLAVYYSGTYSTFKGFFKATRIA